MAEIRKIKQSEYRRTVFGLVHSRLLYWSVLAMVFSYFYNLPVVSYSAKGNNELRLYDLAGVVLVFVFFKHYAVMRTYIYSTRIFSALYDFLFYALVTIIVTAVNAILNNKFYYIFQTLLWYYHFIAFFLTAVFISILIIRKSIFNTLVYLMVFLGMVGVLIVVLQNLGIVPFLWSDDYSRMYLGFLSGTFGPNKIVVGMTCVILIGFYIGLLNEPRVKVNKVLIMMALGVTVLGLVMSGSRTSYVAASVLLGYYSLRQPLSFAYSAIAMFFITLALVSFQPQVLDKALEVYNQRVTNKMRDPEDLQQAKVNELYEDLGAGRKEIAGNYLEILATEYYYIPFGRGFNNRIATASSAHNMYLSLIYEVGLVGLVLYCRWLLSYLNVRMPHFRNLRMTAQAMVIAQIVSLLFGEHLYIYRPVFALLGLFLLAMTLLLSPIYLLDNEE